MKKCHDLSNNQFFIVLKSEIDTYIKECINRNEGKGLAWFLFERPHKPYSATLLLSVFHRRILDIEVNRYVLIKTKDADLIESRCELTIAEKLGLMATDQDYSDDIEEYWHINRESVRFLHAIVGISTKNVSPEGYFWNMDFEFTGDYSKKSGTVYACLCGLLGLFGVHKFYLGKVGTGVFYLLTAGGFGIGLIVDIFKAIFGAEIEDAEGSPLKFSLLDRLTVAIIAILFILLSSLT